MAKIKKIELRLQGKDFVININCNSSGEFTANLPDEIAIALGLTKRQEASTLKRIEDVIYSSYKRYLNAETNHEFFIAIEYKARGVYTFRDGDLDFVLFPSSSEYQMSGFSESIDAIGFEFKVLIKETVDGVSTYYEVRLDKDMSMLNQEAEELKKYKAGRVHLRSHVKLIPYSETALNTLKDARNKLIAISAMLFNFPQKPTEEIESILTSGRLLK